MRSRCSRTQLFIVVAVITMMGCSCEPGIDQLLKRLQHENAGIRSEAAIDLGIRKDPKALSALIKALEDPEYSVRGNAAAALGSIGDPSTVRPLIRLLEDDEKYVRGKAAEAIALFGNQSFEPLKTALAHTNKADIQQQVIRLLGILGDQGAISTIIPYYASYDTRIGRTAYTALKNIDTDWQSNANAAAGFFKVLEGNYNNLVRKKAAQFIGKIKSPAAVDALLKGLADDHKSVKIARITALGELGDPKAVTALVPMLHDSDRHVKHSVIHAFGIIDDPAAIKPLMGNLVDGDYGLVQKAYAVLRDLDADWMDSDAARQAVPQFIQVLKNSTDVKKSAHAATALGAIKDRRAVGPLIKVARSEHALLKARAISALGAIGDPGVYPPAISALKHADRDVRRTAAKALGNFGDDKAIPHLVATLCDRHAGRAAADALVKLEWQPDTDANRIHLLVAQQKTDRLIADWPVVKKILTADLASTEKTVVYNAYHVMVDLKQPDTTALLLKQLETKGSKNLAEVLINGGSPVLQKAAKKWAKKNGFDLIHGFHKED